MDKAMDKAIAQKLAALIQGARDAAYAREWDFSMWSPYAKEYTEGYRLVANSIKTDYSLEEYFLTLI